VIWAFRAIHVRYECSPLAAHDHSATSQAHAGLRPSVGRAPRRRTRVLPPVELSNGGLTPSLLTSTCPTSAQNVAGGMRTGPDRIPKGMGRLAPRVRSGLPQGPREECGGPLGPRLPSAGSWPVLPGRQHRRAPRGRPARPARALAPRN
jgi:hypothetical protein